LQKNDNSIRDDSIKDASITDGKREKMSRENFLSKLSPSNLLHETLSFSKLYLLTKVDSLT